MYLSWYLLFDRGFELHQPFRVRCDLFRKERPKANRYFVDGVNVRVHGANVPPVTCLPSHALLLASLPLGFQQAQQTCRLI